jgi:U3 small nucleolar RNA-associated protein 21
VWAASGSSIIKYLRGKEVSSQNSWVMYVKILQVERVSNPFETALSSILVFGSQLVALTEDGGRMLIWETSEAGRTISDTLCP